MKDLIIVEGDNSCITYIDIPLKYIEEFKLIFRRGSNTLENMSPEMCDFRDKLLGTPTPN